MSPRFRCVTSMVESFSSDFLQTKKFLLFQLLKQPRNQTNGSCKNYRTEKFQNEFYEFKNSIFLFEIFQ